MVNMQQEENLAHIHVNSEYKYNIEVKNDFSNNTSIKT